jgi:hypothetical protein
MTYLSEYVKRQSSSWVQEESPFPACSPTWEALFFLNSPLPFPSLGLEHRTSHILDKRSTIWATPPSPVFVF